MKGRIILALLSAGLATLPASVAPLRAQAPPAETETTNDPAKVQSGDYVLDPDHGKISWSVSHLGFSTFRGAITGVSGTMRIDRSNPAGTALTVSIPMRNVTGLNHELDQQFAGKDWFDTAQFPTATFQAARVEVTGLREARIHGDLMLKGVTRRVVIEAKFNAAGIDPADGKYTLGFDGRTTIKRSDFGVSAFLPSVGDEVALALEAEFKAVP